LTANGKYSSITIGDFNYKNQIDMKLKIILTLAVMVIIIMAFKEINFQKKPWPVPDADKNKKNTVAVNAESIANGKTLWGTHCKSCHGSKGLGDGPKSAQLKTESGDFSLTDFQAQTDGSIFYKISKGRDDMPSYKNKIPDKDDIWSLVNFIRTLKKGGATIPVTKDTANKKPDKPAVVTPPVKKDTALKKDIVVKKDTVVKKDSPVIPKTENIPIQEQVNTLRTRVDSLEKEINLLKEKLSVIVKDSVLHN